MRMEPQRPRRTRTFVLSPRGYHCVASPKFTDTIARKKEKEGVEAGGRDVSRMATFRVPAAALWVQGVFIIHSALVRYIFENKIIITNKRSRGFEMWM